MEFYNGILVVLLFLSFSLCSSSGFDRETPISGEFLRVTVKDPLNNFRKYTSGWNISNRHYLASCGYTVAPLFSIAIACFASLGLALVLRGCYYCCFPRRKLSYCPTAYVVSILLLILLTSLAVIGCIILYKWQDKFHDSTSATLDFVMEQSSTISSNIKNFSTVLASIKDIGGARFSIPADKEISLIGAITKLNNAADNVMSKTTENTMKFKKIFYAVQLVLVISAAVMLLVLLLGFIFSILGIQFLVYILVLVGWFLVTGMLILSGVFLFLHNLLADTCVAMDEWVVHPRVHTSLDEVFPCMDTGIGIESLSQSREVTSQVVNYLNLVIRTAANINYSPHAKSIYYNQSGTFVPQICNPYSKSKNNHTCLAGEVGLKNASEVWLNNVCKVISGTEMCVTKGRITPSMYIEMSNAVNLSYTIYEYDPLFRELANCGLLRQTFRSINLNECPDLKHHSNQVCIGLLILSIAAMLCVILWIVHGRERWHRRHSQEITPQTPTVQLQFQKNNL